MIQEERRGLLERLERPLLEIRTGVRSDRGSGLGEAAEEAVIR